MIFSAFIKPRHNPILSDYFINLTGIKQEIIEQRGVDFMVAIEKFSSWAGSYNLYSYGSDDIWLVGNCRLIGIKFPFERHRFFDIRDVFKKFGIEAENYTSGTIVKAFGKEPTNRAHDALNDARIIIDALKELSRN